MIGLCLAIILIGTLFVKIVSGFFQPREWAIPRQFGESQKEVLPPKDEWITFDEYLKPKLENRLEEIDGKNCIVNLDNSIKWCE